MEAHSEEKVGHHGASWSFGVNGLQPPLLALPFRHKGEPTVATKHVRNTEAPI